MKFMIKFLHILPSEIFVSACVCLCQSVNKRMNVYNDIKYVMIHCLILSMRALPDFEPNIFFSLFKTKVDMFLVIVNSHVTIKVSKGQ